MQGRASFPFENLDLNELEKELFCGDEFFYRAPLEYHGRKFGWRDIAGNLIAPDKPVFKRFMDLIKVAHYLNKNPTRESILHRFKLNKKGGKEEQVREIMQERMSLQDARPHKFPFYNVRLSKM